VERHSNKHQRNRSKCEGKWWFATEDTQEYIVNQDQTTKDDVHYSNMLVTAVLFRPPLTVHQSGLSTGMLKPRVSGSNFSSVEFSLLVYNSKLIMNGRVIGASSR